MFGGLFGVLAVLNRFKTRRTVSNLRIHEISYAAR
jgi:hypothetical protein